jgi:sortase A
MTLSTERAPGEPGVDAGAHRPERLGPLRRGVREVGLGLITLGIVVLAFVVYQLWGTSFTERANQNRLRANFLAAPAAPLSSSPAPATGPSAPVGAAIDHLVIPRIGLDTYVIEGVGESDLVNGPGHYPGTVLPGQDGNAAIAGHRTTYGAPFFNLDALRPGDVIEVTARGGQPFRYQVTGSSVVSPDDVAVLDPTAFPELTLTTCNPRYSATSRLIVTAKLVGQPVAVSTATANVAPRPAAASLGGGNHRAWPPAIGYGALFVALWVLTRLLINRTRRWRRLGAYVGGIAVCCVPLWFCFENVVRLLPQSI